jgi:hypothetical protein
MASIYVLSWRDRKIESENGDVRAKALAAYGAECAERYRRRSTEAA